MSDDGDAVSPRRQDSSGQFRPLGKESPHNGFGMANSSPPNRREAKRSTDQQATATHGMARSDPQDEGVAEFEGKRPCEAGDLGALGEPTLSAARLASFEKLSLDQLRPGQVTWLLNSTQFGSVLSERQLFRHRQHAGNRIGSSRRVNLWAYAAWLIHERIARRFSVAEIYSANKKRSRSRIRELMNGKGCKTVNVPQVLKLLETQDRRCALSGRELSPASTALDHILPVSRGGQHNIRNAQLLNKDVNRAKGTLTNEEFIELCRDVTRFVEGRDERI